MDKRVLRKKDWVDVQMSACNKLYEKELLLGKQFPENRYYEDNIMAASVMLDVNKMVHIDLPYYNYCCDNMESITRRKKTDKHVIDLWDMKLEEIRLLSDRGHADISHALLKKMFLDISNLIGIYTVKHFVSGETVKYLKQWEKLLWPYVRRLVIEESVGQRLRFYFAHYMKVFYAVGLKLIRVYHGQ